VTAFLLGDQLYPPLSLSLSLSPCYRSLHVSTVTQLPHLPHYRMQFISVPRRAGNLARAPPSPSLSPAPPRPDLARVSRERRRSSKLKSSKRIRRERETRVPGTEQGAGSPLPGISNSARFQSASVFRGGNPAWTRTRRAPSETFRLQSKRPVFRPCSLKGTIRGLPCDNRGR